MTLGEADLAVLTETAVTSRIVDVDGIPMSALVAEAQRPRAVVVAMHGGATSSAYFDCPNQPRLSLLRAGAALGFTVVAIDRPGYGSSGANADEVSSPARRVDLAYATVDRLLAARPRGAGLFLLAHSIGCELAVRMAADERGSDLLGMELAGTGRYHHPEAAETMAEVRQRDGSLPMRARLHELIWYPHRGYPADVVGGASIASATPAYEGAVVRRWAALDFPDLAARIRSPVHFTLGEHEMVWNSGPAALADIAAMFTAAPRVVVNEQADSGHNLSLGLSALAYHLTVLAFVEECVLAREMVS